MYLTFETNIETIIRRLKQIKNQGFFLELRQNIQTMNTQTFLLSVLAVILLVLLFFFSLGFFSKTAFISVDFHQPNITRRTLTKSKLVQNQEEPLIFSKYEYLKKPRKPSENVIAFLVASFTGDARLAFNPYPRLREKIVHLDQCLSDNNITDVIIFHTGYPFRADLIPIIESTHRQVEFVNVDHIFYKFSSGFDPHITDPTWSQKGKWNYHHMCYFWFKQVFELKIMQRYRYMMRLDDDSQILGNWPNVFDIMVKRQALYIANRREVDYEYVLPGITLVRNFTADYIIKNKIIAQNPVMLTDVFNQTMEVPNYWNNFEVLDLSFIWRKEVLDFIQAVDKSRAIFIYRWGDAPLRYIMLALFANATQVLDRTQLGLAYCHPC